MDIKVLLENLRKKIEENRIAGKKYAIVFCDLVGSTEYKSGREITTSLIKVFRHNAEVEEQVTRQNGKMIKSLGDGILATFEINKPDDIICPLEAAINTMQSFTVFNKNIIDSEQILSRIGITCGDVIDFSVINPKGEKVFDPQGPVVDLAARLCSLAAPAQILCDEEVFLLASKLKGKYNFSSRQERLFKGFTSPIAVYSVKWGEKQFMDIPYNPPILFENGFLTTDFVMSQIKESQKIFRLIGLSNRFYSDNVDLFNIISKKIQINPNYKFYLYFLNPNSDFKRYAEYITRRRVKDLKPIVIENIRNACNWYKTLDGNIEIICLDYPLIIPFIQRDDFIFFSLPFRSKVKCFQHEGIIGGSYFTIDCRSNMGQMILENLNRDKQVKIPIIDVAEEKCSINKIL